MQHTFDVNSTGTMRVITQFLPFLEKGDAAKIVNISSQLGSLQTMTRKWGRYSYNSSKAALNMLTRMFAFDLEDKGIAVICIHPGWVQTDMGGTSADITPTESASGILSVIDNLTLAETGQFYTYAGDEHLWYINVKLVSHKKALLKKQQGFLFFYKTIAGITPLVHGE